MTSRNVRKLIDLMLGNIRRELYAILGKRLEMGGSLNIRQREFMKHSAAKYGGDKTLLTHQSSGIFQSR
jgi:hypothetical protein